MINWKLFGIPIHIRASFVMLVLLLGWMSVGGGRSPFALLGVVLFLPIVTVSVLLHELGHALLGRAFGMTPHVELHGMGGTTSWSPGTTMGPWRRIAVSLAGPGVGIVVGGIVGVVWMFFPPPDNSLAKVLFMMTVWVNLGWGLLNLIPMLPLDGGNVMASFLEVGFGSRGVRAARVVSIGVAVVVGGLSLWIRQPLWTMLCGLFALTNFQALRAEQQLENEKPVMEELEHAEAALRARNKDEAKRRADAILASSAREPYKARAIEILAWLRVMEDDAAGAKTLLDGLPQGYTPSADLVGIVLVGTGRADEALEPLRDAYESTKTDAAADALARALVETSQWEEAVRLVREQIELEPPQRHAFERVERAAFDSGRFPLAAELGERYFERVTDGAVAYNVACALARAGRLDDALTWLGRAGEAGFAVLEHAASDADLASLQGRFGEINGLKS